MVRHFQRHPARDAPFVEDAWVYGDCHSHNRARHRPEHGNVQHHQCDAYPAASLCRSRPHCHDLECMAPERVPPDGHIAECKSHRWRRSRTPGRCTGVRLFFPILGVQPLLGRTFNPTEDVAGANRVVVLSYGLWQRRFARDRTIIGCDLVLDGAHYKVIGVMPREFRFSIGVKMSKLVSPPVDFWTPLAMDATEQSTWGSVSVYTLARLKPGVSYAQAQTEVESLRRALF
jgi:hypothetical protein